MNDDTGIPAVSIQLDKLREWSPFRTYPWYSPGEDTEPLTREEVRIAIEEERFQEEPVGYPSDRCVPRKVHVERIAYMVVNHDSTPLDIDMGVPSFGCCPTWPIEDGNHRLAAAFYRFDHTIDAYVSGETDYIEETLGVRNA